MEIEKIVFFAMSILHASKAELSFFVQHSFTLNPYKAKNSSVCLAQDFFRRNWQME